MKKYAFFVLILILLFTSCIKYRTKYSCEKSCADIKINLSVNNKSGENLLANTNYEIILLDKFSGSGQNNRIMACGISDNNGNFNITVNCDTSLLNTDDYYIQIKYEWDVNSIKVCWELPTDFNIETYPQNGIFNMNIETLKRVQKNVKFIKKSPGIIKSANVQSSFSCYSSSASLNTSINIEKNVGINLILNNINLIKIKTTDTLNNIQYYIDSIFVDNSTTFPVYEY